MSWIGVLDCNNFFVSCERLFRPDLQKRPMVVLSSNDGCIVARSQEIKDNGIPMGVPYFQVKDKLLELEAKVFSSHLALYRDVSRRVFVAMREELSEVEQYSIDEAFFRVEHDPEAIARRLKSRVEQMVGIPVSIGIAASKTQAKFVNQVAKKTTGAVVWGPEEWRTQSTAIHLGEIWGVGGRLAQRYRRAGFVTVHDILITDPLVIRSLFGIMGVRLQRELAGFAAYPVTVRTTLQKSLVSSRSFAKTITDLPTISDAVAYHVRHVAADLRAMNCGALAIRISLRPSRYGAFALRGGSQEITFNSPTDDTPTLLRAASEMLSAVYQTGVPYQKAGVSIARLALLQSNTASLFEEPPSSSAVTIDSVIDTLNQKWGRTIIEQGRQTRADAWRSTSAMRSPAYTTRWSDIATVMT